VAIERLNDSEAQALGAQFRKARERAGLSQEEVAHRAGMSAHQYGLLENGLSDRRTRAAANPGTDTWRALVRVFSEVLPGFHVDLRYAESFEVTFHYE
jgi:DNA-binding XRE family transcriptional regulator